MPVSSDLQQYTVSDFLEWHGRKQLELNPEFQRGSVWPPAARTYLIDTILRRLPIPKLYLRTRVDLETKRSYREVVDGQQRLRAILDFANNRFTLGSRAGEFASKRYDDLEPDIQERFLSYAIAVEQLINATDADVLEVFSRLNSYTVPVNPPELRHAKYQGEFKWAVHDLSQRWSRLWEEFRVVGSRDAVRLLSDSLMAEMFGLLLEGITDGGQPKISKLYDRHDSTYERGVVDSRVDAVLDYIVTNFGEVLSETNLSSAPHFLMLFGAVAHVRYGLPKGELESLPARQEFGTVESAVANLYKISEIITAEEPPRGAISFANASTSSTQRIASRKIRFPVYVAAVQDQSLPW